MIFTATTTATRAQTTPWKQQQQRPRFLTSRASVSFSSSSSSLLSKSSSSKGGRQQPRGHRRRSLPSEGAKTGRGVVVAGRFPDERTYIMIKCVVVYVVVVFRLSSWLLLDFLTSSNSFFSTKPRGFFYPLLLVLLSRRWKRDKNWLTEQQQLSLTINTYYYKTLGRMVCKEEKLEQSSNASRIKACSWKVWRRFSARERLRRSTIATCLRNRFSKISSIISFPGRSCAWFGKARLVP